jgi:hypothetical protein
MVEKDTSHSVAMVAYRGILEQFKLYTALDGRKYVILPDGRRGYIRERRDGTYLVER